MAHNDRTSSSQMQNEKGFDWFKTSEKATVVLELVVDVAKLAPLPYLGQAAQLVLNIIKSVQEVEQNRRDYEGLAREAADLITVIFRSYQKANKPEEWGDEFHAGIQTTLNTLESIHDLVREKAGKKKVSSFFIRKTNGREIEDCRGKLRESFRLFVVFSVFELRNSLVEIQRMLTEKQSEERRAQNIRHIDFMSDARNVRKINVKEKFGIKDSGRLDVYHRVKGFTQEGGSTTVGDF